MVQTMRPCGWVVPAHDGQILAFLASHRVKTKIGETDQWAEIFGVRDYVK